MKHITTQLGDNNTLMFRGNNRVLQVSVNKDEVTFTEGCDEHFNISLPVADALVALEELKQEIIRITYEPYNQNSID